jgi:RNA polymerase sigma-70 factor (ECF subfamily)
MLDEDLIAGLKIKSRVAFDFLIQRYSLQVINTCFKFLLNKEDAEDLAQEVFIEVYLSIHSFRGEAKLSTWIYRIAVTKSLDEIKKRNRKKRISFFAKKIHLDDVANWVVGNENPEQNIHTQDKMNELFELLNTLPDNQRVAYTLSKIEGYSNIEIAEIMNISISSIESLNFRAKQKIYKSLEEILRKK